MEESNETINGEKKLGKRIKIWLLVILILLLILMAAAAAVVLPLYQSYKESYMHIDIITRDSEYSRPDYPSDIVFETGDLSDSDADGLDTGDFDTDDTDLPPDTTGPAVTDGPSDTTEPETEEVHEVIDNGIYYVPQKNPNVENILILGTDSRNVSSDRGRSDSMIIASYNKKTGEVNLVSLLRDLLVPIEGHDWNRLNAAYAFGGVSLCINTINEVLDLDIQKFVVVNFAGVESFIDRCGGIDLSLTAAEVDYLTNYEKHVLQQNADGTYHLDGTIALAHMRNRRVGYDFARTERQRQVILALYSKVVSTKSLTEIYNLVREGFKLVRTNIKLNHLLDLTSSIVSTGSNLKITSERIPQNGTYQNVIYKKKSVLYFDIDENSLYLNELIYGE